MRGGCWKHTLVFFLTLALTGASVVSASENRPFPPQIESGTLFLSAIKQSKQGPDSGYPTGITVPHHLLAADVIADTFAHAARGTYAHVLLVSPDHFHLGTTNISIAEKDFLTPFGKIKTNSDWVQKFERIPSVRAATFFYREHGIQAELPFIKYDIPSADIVAVTFRYETPRKELDAFVNTAKQIITPDTLIVQSTDFSHYLPATEASVHDQETKRILEAGDPGGLFSLHQPSNLDSIASQYVQMRLQQEFFGSQLSITTIKNSQSYTKEFVDKTTSYIAQVYTKNTPQALNYETHASGTSLSGTAALFPAKEVPSGGFRNSEPQELTIPHTAMTFVGDIMLGRHVETLMNTIGAAYPFKNISPLFEKSSMAVGNLEGPIAITHTQTPNDSLHFSFPRSIAQTLAHAHITHVSLGNNHTGDQGTQGLAFTKSTLRDAGVAPFGDPRDITHSPLWHGVVDGRDVTLFSVHATHRISFAEVESKIATIKKEYPQTFLIVQPHWGTEYRETSNTSQQELAHRMITKGADMVIGHHPHVIQEIERYNGHLIFYSLGNCIFDQYFSQQTQEGLMLRLSFRRALNYKTPASGTSLSSTDVLFAAKEVPSGGFRNSEHGDGASITLVPLLSQKSQPAPMDAMAAQKLLKNLAARSDQSLTKDIKQGVINF